MNHSFIRSHLQVYNQSSPPVSPKMANRASPKYAFTSTQHKDINFAYRLQNVQFAPPNSPSNDAYHLYQQMDHSLESPANAAMIEARIKDLETQHRFAHSRMEQPYSYPNQDIPETPRNHSRRGTRTPLRHMVQHQATNFVAPPADDIQTVWARTQSQEPWYQNPSDPATVPAGTPAMTDHDSYSTPHRPSNAYNAPPASSIPIPYEWCSPEAAAVPLPPPGFENSTLGTPNGSPRQSLHSYRSRSDSEGSHYDSALSSYSPCSVHSKDGSLKSNSVSSVGPSSPALSTSSLYTAYSCMYCLASDDNGYTNQLAPDSSQPLSPASPQVEVDEDGYRLRPIEPSSPGFAFSTSSPYSNSSPHGLLCSSDDDGSILVPVHGPGPIRRPGSVEDQTSAFLKRRQERLARMNDDCLEEEKLDSIKFMLEAELLI